MKLLQIIILGIIVCSQIACEPDMPSIIDDTIIIDQNDTIIRAADISQYPVFQNTIKNFKDVDGQSSDFLDILKDHGINTIRLRLWVNPEDEYATLTSVQNFSNDLRKKGFKIWITLHYSDTWADPGHQEIPEAWQSLDINQLITQIYDYTADVVEKIKPEFIQIGNEINPGFLLPQGKISSNKEQFIDLLEAGISAVRDHHEQSKIMIHYAGIQGAEWFYNQIQNLDYDIIGLSYYPIWHGKDLSLLESTLQKLATDHSKDVLIAETSYPFTLGWNDWTDNVVGLQEQLIIPDFPATEEGQYNFMNAISDIVHNDDKIKGFCYWGAEMIAFDGSESKEGSTWENQALFDFENRALPALQAFKKR